MLSRRSLFGLLAAVPVVGALFRKPLATVFSVERSHGDLVLDRRARYLIEVQALVSRLRFTGGVWTWRMAPAEWQSPPPSHSALIELNLRAGGLEAFCTLIPGLLDPDPEMFFTAARELVRDMNNAGVPGRLEILPDGP